MSISTRSPAGRAVEGTGPVPIWQGSADELVRPELERALAATVPTSELRLFQDEGHYLPVRHADALLRLFVGAPLRGTAR